MLPGLPRAICEILGRSSSASDRISVFTYHDVLEHVANRGDSRGTRARLAPNGPHGARRRRLRELAYGKPSLRSERRLDRRFGKQGDTESGDDHLAQSFQARGAKILGFANVDTA